MDPGLAKAELALLDGGAGLSTLGLPALKSQGDDPGELTFTIPGEDGTGTLSLQFEEIGRNGSRIHVALDLPVHKATIDGKAMVLDEGKAEKVLQEGLARWAEGKSSGYASLDALNQALTGLSLAMLSDAQRGKLDMAGAQEATRDFAAEEAGSDSPELLADASGASTEPMDDAQGSIDASRPMDETQGMVDAAEPMDDASGDEPMPEFGDPDY